MNFWKIFNDMYELFFSRLYRLQGRSSRKEFVARLLLLVILVWVRYYIDRYRPMAGQPLFSIFNLLTALFLLIYIIQYFPLAARRLHDLNENGWYALITFLPFGRFFILWLILKKGTPGPNKYGEPPVD